MINWYLLMSRLIDRLIGFKTTSVHISLIVMVEYLAMIFILHAVDEKAYFVVLAVYVSVYIFTLSIHSNLLIEMEAIERYIVSTQKKQKDLDQPRIFESNPLGVLNNYRPNKLWGFKQALIKHLAITVGSIIIFIIRWES